MQTRKFTFLILFKHNKEQNCKTRSYTACHILWGKVACPFFLSLLLHSYFGYIIAQKHKLFNNNSTNIYNGLKP